MLDEPGGKEVVACLLCITSYIHSTKLCYIKFYQACLSTTAASLTVSYYTYISLFIHILQGVCFLSWPRGLETVTAKS